ncbi:zinc finger protein 415-like [Anoplophora glabripennis]|uniref:zinc finger protein 415-like n=1 Tax=Anoplophora glabripennis TaxID=217634 RepID=UPI000873F481|nr:zinc finger protein 415-like [Anoplophora glabripennis]
MTSLQETSCRFCLKTVIDESFEVINNIIRDILDVLLLKLKFDSEGKEVICNVCRGKLHAALEFKSACLKTDYTIIPYLDCEKMLQLDIRDVYTTEKTSESMDISDGQKICRLCMEPVDSEFRCICEEELEAIEKLAPELIINIVKDPVICKECFDSVCTHNNFLKDCLESEEKIKSIFDSSASGSQIDTSPFDLFVKTENEDKEFDINEMEMSIKAECVDIKSEDEERSDSLLQSSDSEPFQKSVFYKIGSESRFIAQNDSGVYKCESCGYETENKNFFQKHRLRHKDRCQVRMYRCNDCDYETKYKSHIKRHQMKHKDPSRVQMYKCKDCGYESKYRENIKRHQLKHKDPSQVQMYMCNYCGYETKYKSYIKSHQLQHKDSSQVQMYRCNYCEHEIVPITEEEEEDEEQ